MKIIQNFNRLLANKMSLILSSMWLFWIVLVILLVAAFLRPPDNVYEWVMYVISAGFQALALPVLAFVSDIQGEKQKKVIDQTHKAVLAQLEIIQKQQKELEGLISSEKIRFIKITEEMNEIDEKIEKVDEQLG